MHQIDLDGYWQQAEYIGWLQLPLDEDPCDIFLFWHHAPELDEQGPHVNGMLPFSGGAREYLHAKACTMLPCINITLGLTLPADGDDKQETRQDLEVHQAGWLRFVLAKLQAWYYHDVKTLLIEEVDIMSSHSAVDPNEDVLLLLLWETFEQRLLARFPACERIVIPGWEPEYDRQAYHWFLTKRGYTPHDNNTYGKLVNEPY